MSKKTEWYHFTMHENELNFAANNITVITAGTKKICLAKFNNTLKAFAYKCPHASGILADGYLDMHGNIICPLHRFKFNIATGQNSSGEGYYLKTYPLEEREDGWYVGIEKDSWWE